MPYCNMLNAWMLLPDEVYHMLQSLRKSFSLSLKLDPAMLKLTMTFVVNRLPVIVNDEVGDVDIVFSKGGDRL